ncbi:MAG: metallophosphoesterase family protein, partial [Sphaerochaetaceae bacterium]
VPPRYITVDFYGRLLFITHGDLISDWTSCPQSLSERDLFISGHTHKARLIHPKGGPICLNPGSLSSPRDSSPPSYAIVSKEKIEVKSLVDKQVLETLSLTEECQL